MKFVIQRAASASVSVNEQVVGSIRQGYLVLIGVCDTDTEAEADRLVRKMLNLRIFSDENGKTNLSLKDVNGELLLISQFTLYADCRRGRRPSFDGALSPVPAEALYNQLVLDLRERLGERLQCGEFGASMRVHITNWGPVTIMLDSKEF